MSYSELKNKYCQFLFETQGNFTCTYMASHISLSHDEINRYLLSCPLGEASFYEQVHLDRVLPFGGYLIFDDTVLDKSHSRQIEMVRRQYSGNAGKVIKGIGVVNMVYYIPQTNQYYLLGYRIFDPDLDEKSKITHVRELLQEAENKCIGYIGVLMDTWYAVSELFQVIDELGKKFYCPIKPNRLVKTINLAGKQSQKYASVDSISWNEEQQVIGQEVKVKNLDMSVKLYKVPVSTNRTDYVLTNDMSENTTENIATKQKMRWNIECFHREIKQLTGIEKCQCRKALAQRTHIFCAMLVWNKIKTMAYETFKTAYQIKNMAFSQFLYMRLSTQSMFFA